MFDSIDLRPVEVGQISGREMSGEVASEHHILYFVAKEFVVDVSGDRTVVHGELLQRGLHPIEAGGLPDKVNHVIAVAVHWDAGVVLQLDPDLVAEIVRDFDHMPNARPGLLKFTQIPSRSV